MQSLPNGTRQRTIASYGRDHVRASVSTKMKGTKIEGTKKEGTQKWSAPKTEGTN